MNDNQMSFSQAPLAQSPSKLSGYLSVALDKNSDQRDISAQLLPRVLFVEDNFVICAAVEAHLVEEGFKVTLASRAADAVLKARTFKPDVIVMDVRLAGPANGIDAAEAIYRASGTRCIFATAHIDPATRASAAIVHPYGWVPKPYAPEDIAEAIKRVFANLSGGNC